MGIRMYPNDDSEATRLKLLGITQETLDAAKAYRVLYEYFSSPSNIPRGRDVGFALYQAVNQTDVGEADYFLLFGWGKPNWDLMRGWLVGQGLAYPQPELGFQVPDQLAVLLLKDKGYDNAEELVQLSGGIYLG